MNISKFVSGTSLLLAVWLGVTFTQKVPFHRYPQLGKDRKNPTALIEGQRSASMAAHQVPSRANSAH